MNNLKPVAWINANNTYSETSTEFTKYGPNRRPLHYIPDTHRIVSVDMLERIIIALARDNNCATSIYEGLREIIDNEGE